MVIGGMQKVTLLDYPNKIACILFTVGCNYRCPFCHNSTLIERAGSLVLNEDVFEYLEKRHNLLDGVVISGGEPTLQKDIEDFIRKIKKLGLEVKLDTNGSNPKVLKNLIDKKLVDYVAMDIKTALDKYPRITRLACNTDDILASIKLLESSSVAYEFRTTVARELHTYSDLESICNIISPKSKYYIQNYRNCETVLEPGLTSFDEEELKIMINILNEKFPNVCLR